MMRHDYKQALIGSEGWVNPHLGVRFDAIGRFLPEHGNTIVAQLAPGSPSEAALVALRTKMRSLPHAAHFAYTDVASYHMTVFEGVVETRRAPGFWPQAVPMDVSIDEATTRMIDLLAGWQAPPPFSMRITEVTPFGLRLTGATPEDERCARDWRNALSVALGYRTPTHDTYRFHTTLAYLITPLPAAAVDDLVTAMDEFTAQIQVALPILHLARPAFCRFSDMNAFPPVLAL